jgi:predicted nucleic acid-binding protein
MKAENNGDFVLDASIALAWCFEDEATPATLALLDTLESHVAHVPSLWGLEVSNILLGAERKKRLTQAQMAQFIELLDQLNIQVDGETANRALHETIALAHSTKLTTYDACYLELAMRLGLPLATKDQALAQAAGQVGVTCYT